MSRFKDKFAIISGGASGMGAATAKRFVEEGGSVVTLDLNEELGIKVAEDMEILVSFLRQMYLKQRTGIDWKNILVKDLPK